MSLNDHQRYALYGPPSPNSSGSCGCTASFRSRCRSKWGMPDGEACGPHHPCACSCHFEAQGASCLVALIGILALVACFGVWASR